MIISLENITNPSHDINVFYCARSQGNQHAHNINIAHTAYVFNEVGQ